MRIVRWWAAVLVAGIAGCGGVGGGGEPVGLYAGHWRGTWDGTPGSDIIDLRIGKNGNVTGTFERPWGSDGSISGSIEPDGDLDVDYDADEDGSLEGRLVFDESINRIKGTLTWSEGEDSDSIVIHATRR